MAEFRFNHQEKGFTLAEVLVVVVILGILVAIAVPIFRNNIIRANRTVVEANLKTIDSAIMQFKAAHEGNIPKKDDDLSTYLQTWPEGPDGVEYTVKKGRTVIAKKSSGAWFTANVNDSLPISWEEDKPDNPNKPDNPDKGKK